MPLPRLLSLAEVARATHAPVSSVRYWVYSGRLRSVKAGRRRLVAEDDLTRFLGLDAPSDRGTEGGPAKGSGR